MSDLYNSVSAFQMIIIISFSPFENNTCRFPNYQKIFQQYKTNSGQYRDRELCRIFSNPFEESCADAEPTVLH